MKMIKIKFKEFKTYDPDGIPDPGIVLQHCVTCIVEHDSIHSSANHITI